ncbi:MAG: phosphoglucomutase, alpha-D-glucose phosphate-specific, partial [Candidatus Solibacter usitatus]|nr:phosphoglucomutase, alpha-D-glucose phosphate-specific [Candidatus Solibacter usitatus]
MALNPLAGKPAPAELLIDVAALERAYYEVRPDADDAQQLVSFGTSGHRGTSTNGTFNEPHILATAQAICDYRNAQGHGGPLFL